MNSIWGLMHMPGDELRFEETGIRRILLIKQLTKLKHVTCLARVLSTTKGDSKFLNAFERCRNAGLLIYPNTYS